MAVTRTTQTIKDDIERHIKDYEQSRNHVFRWSGYGEYEHKTKILDDLKKDLQQFYESGYNLDLSNPASTAATCAAVAAAEASDKTPAPRSNDLLSKLIGYMERAYLLNNRRRTNIHILLDNIFKILVNILVEKLTAKDKSVYNLADNFLDCEMKFDNFFKIEDYLFYYINIANAYEDNPYKEFHQKKGRLTNHLYNYSLRAERTSLVTLPGYVVSGGLFSTAVIGITRLAQYGLPKDQRTFIDTDPALPIKIMKKVALASQLFILINKSFRMNLITKTKDSGDQKNVYVFFDTLQTINDALQRYGERVTTDTSSELRSIMIDMKSLALNAIHEAPEQIRKAILEKHPSISSELIADQASSAQDIELREMPRQDHP